MIVRQLKEKAYHSFLDMLLKDAHSSLLCPIYHLDITVNHHVYALYLQPDKHNKVYALYALCTATAGFTNLITDGNVLSALLELVIYQTKNQD